jgi:DNA-binding response OmpR family regulator
MARILVVDDDTDILKITEQVLGSAGHSVFVAEDALRAIDWLNHTSFDLLISDVNMPHYSGLQLVSTIRNNPKFSSLAIAMLTGMRERKDVEKAMDIGVDDYIIKPLDPLILLQKVNALFDKRPPKRYPEITLGRSALAQGHLKRALTVETISELGVRVLTDLSLRPGMVVDIGAEFFVALDVEIPPMKVLSVEIDAESGSQRAQLIFLAPREAFLKKIRHWLYTHGASARAAS